MIDVRKVENNTLKGLKDFQLKTVERIDYLFRNKQRRILVADEVGLGKTLVARGAIAKMAVLREEEHDPLFKVVYICSNQVIANQNIQKLNITGNSKVENIKDTRLSMQHLKIAEQENDVEIRDNYIQLIPLTPDTSFRMTKGVGDVNERALMYAILYRADWTKGYRPVLDDVLKDKAEKSWNGIKYEFDYRVHECEKKTKKAYPGNVLKAIDDYDKKHPIKDDVINFLKNYRKGIKDGKSRIINRLRSMFAEVSAELLQPDFVIMDEFQRFKFLLDSDDESDTGILARKFLESGDTRILLLSATPYKLYSTLEEIDETDVDEHYHEFFQVMDFLFQGKDSHFHKLWSDYSIALHEIKDGDTAIIVAKNNAESAMYQGVCRTERISVMDSGDYTDDSSVAGICQ